MNSENSDDKEAFPPPRDSSLTKSGLQTLVVKITAVGLGFVAQVLLAKMLGKIGYGEYAFAVTSLSFLVIAAIAGSDMVATRFVAEYQADAKQLRTHINWLGSRLLRISLAISIVALIALQLVWQFDNRGIWPATQVLVLAIPLQSFAMLRQGILRGLQKPVMSVLPEGLFRPLFTIQFSIVAYMWATALGLEFKSLHAVWVYVLVSAFVLVAGKVILGWYLPKTKQSLPADNLNQTASQALWRSMAFASMFSAAAMTIHAQSDIWMLGVLTNAELVGPYSAAAKYATFVVFGINAVNTSLAPLVSRVKNDQNELQVLASKAAKISFLIGGPISVVLLLAPGTLLNFFGPEFDDAAFCLQVLAAANLINVCCGSVGSLLSMTGNHSAFMRLLVSSVVLNVALNASLIPIWGINGAAFSTATSIVYWNFAALIIVKRRLKIRPAIGGII